MSELFEGLGRRAHAARAALRLTMEDLADRVGVNRQYIGKIENNQAPGLTIATADLLAQALGVPLPYLLFGDNTHPELPKAMAELVEVVEELPMHRQQDLMKIATTFLEEEKQARRHAGSSFDRMIQAYAALEGDESAVKLARQISDEASAYLSAVRPGKFGGDDAEQKGGLHRR